MKFLSTILIVTILVLLSGCYGTCGPFNIDGIEASAVKLKMSNTPITANDVTPILDSSEELMATDFIIEVNRVSSTHSNLDSFLSKINFSLFNNAQACSPIEFSEIAIYSIVVTSDADFSEDKPAGTNLNDLFFVEYYKYSNMLDTTFYHGLEIGELIEQNVKKMDRMQIRLNESPSKAKVHKFTIQINEESFLLDQVTLK